MGEDYSIPSSTPVIVGPGTTPCARRAFETCSFIGSMIQASFQRVTANSSSPSRSANVAAMMYGLARVPLLKAIAVLIAFVAESGSSKSFAYSANKSKPE